MRRSVLSCLNPGRLRSVLLLLLLGCFAALTLRAQDDRGKLTVSVTDASGAIIPNASLTLQRGSTKQSTPAATDSTGAFTFQFLEPDTYQISVVAPSMGTSVVTGIVIQAYASTSLPVVLQPAAASSEVTVTSEGTLLQTESASRAFDIDHREVTDLPVINGNPVMLGQDIPGVYMRPLGIYTDPWTVTSQFLVNGGLESLNDFQIDGSPNDAELGANTYAYTPPNFAVKAFTVSANNYDAEYGHTSGGVINLATLSGGTSFHGMGWGSFRRTSWNANTFQNKYENAINDTDANTTPFNSQTQLGFQVGGPVLIPHVLSPSSRFKPFFFFAFDHYTELLPRGLLLSYPTDKMRTGDFSELLGYGVQIDDPLTGHVGTNGDWVRDPFPGNIIPAGRLNPIATAIAKVFPSVNGTPSGQRPGTDNLNISNNYFNWHFHNVLGRFDFGAGEKYKFFVRPFYSNFTEVSNAGGIVGPGEYGGQFSRTSKGFLVDAVDVLSPKTVLEARYGYSFFRALWKSPSNQNFNLSSQGYPASFASSLQQPNFFGDYTFQNYSPIGWFDNVEDTGTYSTEGNISRTLGKHNLRAGWDVRLTHFTFINPGYPTFTSNSDITDADFNNTASENYSGDSFATFLLGTPSTGNTAVNANETISTWYLAPWLQDDWKVSSRLTVNLGLRYDILTAPVDKYNALNVGFDPNAANAVQGQVGGAAGLLPQGASLTGGLLFAGVNGASRSPFATVFHNVQPRAGFAWQASDRLVFRGGYGLFYTNFQSNGMLQQLGFTANTPLVTSNDGGRTPIQNVLGNPYPDGLIHPTGSSLGTLTGVGQGLTVYNRNYKIPDANEFSFGFQYRVLHNSVLDMSYVGNRVIGYDMTYDANLPSFAFQQQCDEIYAQGNNSLCTALKQNPFTGVAAFQGTSYYSSPTIDAYDLNRPHPQFQAVTTSGLNQGHNWYNALQVDYSQKLSHGVSFNTDYVWAKQIEQWGYLNQALNLRQRSPYVFGLPQSFKVFGVFELPVGRGKLLNVRNAVADGFVGGWEFDPDFTVQSGEPAALPANAIPLPHNAFYTHPNWKQQTPRAWNGCVLDYVPGGAPAIPGGTTGVTAQQCGTNPANYDWLEVTDLPYEQTLPSNSSTIRMKPMLLSDAAVQKSFRVREGVSAIVRLQASNVFNHFNLLTARFDTNPNDPPNLFGTVTQGLTPSADAPPRNLNVQFRVTF